MSILNLKSSWNSATGFLAVLIFLFFTITSFALYPGHYSPFNSWVSDLGNVNLNPAGSTLFNWGCIVTGLILVTFFSGLHRWQPHKKCNRVLLMLGVIIGIFSSISLIFVGIFPETDIKMHQIASIGVFSSIFFVIILLNLALFKHPNFIRAVAYYGLFVIIAELVFQHVLTMKNYTSTFNPVMSASFMEWVVVISSLAWIGFLSLNMLMKKI